MLTPQQLEKVADTIVPIWDELKEWITLDLIDRIISRLDSGEDISFSSSEMWRIEVFEELGGLTEDLQEQIVKTTRASENEVRRIFLEYGEQAVRADNAVFDGNNLASTEENTSYKPENSSVQAENRRDVNDVSTAAEIPSESRTGDETAAENKPLDNISDRMKDIMNDAYERTNGELRNFTRTTADSVQTEFIKELDRAYLKVVSNACSQWQAAQEAVDNIIKHQGYVTYPSGHVDTIEVAVIRAIRTGVARMSAALVVEGAKKHGMNHVLVSSHLGARVGDGTESPCNHAWWQGKVYSIEGGDEKYPNLEKVTGYPSDPRGLCGYNCRHNLTAFDPETMKNHFEKFDDEENKKAYEFSQKLRYYERNIRKAKTEITAFSKAVENCKDENLAEHFQTELDKAKARLDRLNEEYKKLCEDNDLRVAYERLYVARTPRNIEILRNEPVANSAESGIINVRAEMHRKFDPNQDRRKDLHFVSDTTFSNLTVEARINGANILRGGEEVEHHLDTVGADASIVGDTILFRKDVCVSEVLEETHHYMQNLNHMNDDKPEPLRTYLNEIDAKEYLLNNARKYKIPRNEIETTKKQLESYKAELEKYVKEFGEYE